MQYNNENVRRQDRLLSEEDALNLLQNGEYGVLSLIDEAGQPYGLPINYVWNGKSSIYLHCAPEGKKLRSIAHNSAASFCIVGHTGVVSNKFTTNYESVILQCRAVVGLDEAERMYALRIFLEKYSPNDIEIGMKYAEKSFHRTQIIRLDIQEYSAKSKRVHP